MAIPAGSELHKIARQDLASQGPRSGIQQGSTLTMWCEVAAELERAAWYGWKHFPHHPMVADCLGFCHETEAELRPKEENLLAQEGESRAVARSIGGSRPLLAHSGSHRAQFPI